MALEGYLKISEPGRISSVGSTLTHRKKILQSVDESVINLYVVDCESHKKPSPVVSIMLRKKVNGLWQELGIAKVCPLCWIIITPPEGVELPPPRKQIFTGNHSRILAKLGVEEKPKKKTRKQRPVSTVPQRILNYVAAEDATVYDIMELLDITRSPARRHLERLVSEGKLVAEREGPGRDHVTTYSLQE